MKLKKGFRQMVDEAKARITTLSLEETRARHAKGDVVFVDLRDVRELEREGMIPGAFHCPRGMLEFWIDPESPYHKDMARHEAEYRRCRAELEERIARRPPPTKLPMALYTGEFLPLDQQRALGIHVYRRSDGPQVKSKFDLFRRSRPSR